MQHNGANVPEECQTRSNTGKPQKHSRYFYVTNIGSPDLVRRQIRRRQGKPMATWMRRNPKSAHKLYTYIYVCFADPGNLLGMSKSSTRDPITRLQSASRNTSGECDRPTGFETCSRRNGFRHASTRRRREQFGQSQNEKRNHANCMSARSEGEFGRPPMDARNFAI